MSNIFFCGIGGVSMSGLAAMTAARGISVSGSDRESSEATRRLESLGIKVFIGQKAENLANSDTFIYTAAISPDNPEYAEALRRGLTMIGRAEYLGALMSEYGFRIGVSGTHGKSTTTAMTARIFEGSGRNPTVACGADIPEYNAPYKSGGGDYFIYEACEYKDSFLSFSPNFALILNVDYDHADYFKNIDQVIDSFARSVVKAYCVFFNGDDENSWRAVELADQMRGGGLHAIDFAVDRADAYYRAVNISYSPEGSEFDILCAGEFLAHIKLPIPGRHNVYDALAAAAVSHYSPAKISGTEIADALSGFRGAARRFELKGTLKNGARVYDDYAHHPAEIRATLSAAIAGKKDGGRVIVVYQPHTYSRTAALRDGFAKELGTADVLILVDIYAAREKNLWEMSSEKIAELVSPPCDVHCLHGFGEIADYVWKIAEPNDTVIIMGAGNVFEVREKLLER